MIQKSRAIVLHTTRYGESSLVVHAYSEQFGRHTYMVKGVRKSRKQNRAHFFQPLFILDLEVYVKSGADMHLVKEVSLAQPMQHIPFDIVRSTQAIFIAEIIYRTVREEEPNPLLAGFLFHTVQLLDALEESNPDFHIVFLFHLSKYLGFYPQRKPEGNQPWFHLEKGRFVSVPGDPSLLLDKEESELWKSYMSIDYKEMDRSVFNGKQRKSVLDMLMRYYRLHVDGMGDVRSLEVLHDFFHNS